MHFYLQSNVDLTEQWCSWRSCDFKCAQLGKKCGNLQTGSWMASERGVNVLQGFIVQSLISFTGCFGLF